METAKYVKIIPKRLYWVCDSYPPAQVLAYEPLQNDFGPVDIGKVHKYCVKLQSILESEAYADLRIYHYTGVSAIKKTNSALMICAFQVIVLNREVQEAWSRFSNVYFPEFRDASMGPCNYLCSITHCLKALHRAMSLNWYNFKTFDLKTYEFYANIKNGDLNWIVPNKLLTLSSPNPNNIDFYINIMKRLGVTAIVRCNQKNYPGDRFKKHGIRFFDLYFKDGSCPSEEILRKFFAIVENEKGAVAVHCRAGLGRAGTLAGCFLMKHHEFSGCEAIAWTRMCRPGSVLGPQQLFLVEIEETCVKWGEAFKQSLQGSSIFGGKNLEEKIPMRRRSFDAKSRERYSRSDLEKGQAKALVSIKAKNQSANHYNIDDRDAISPPAYYRKRTFLEKVGVLTQNIFVKDLVSITLATPTKKPLKLASL